MKKKVLAAFAAIALLLMTDAQTAVNTLAIATATTTTADTGVVTSERRIVTAMTWNTAGTATVLLEEQVSEAASVPWTLVATMVDCNSSGVGTVNGTAATPCSFSTLTPRVRTRLRVSACSGCSVNRVIQDVPK